MHIIKATNILTTATIATKMTTKAKTTSVIDDNNERRQRRPLHQLAWQWDVDCHGMPSNRLKM